MNNNTKRPQVRDEQKELAEFILQCIEADNTASVYIPTTGFYARQDNKKPDHLMLTKHGTRVFIAKKKLINFC